MASNKSKVKPWAGDPKREAVGSLRGYLYQIWHTVHAWLELQTDDILFLEVAEDFDVVTLTKATATQVKDTARKLTLRSPDVIQAISNFWSLARRNPQQRVFFRFLTRSRIGVEKESPFGTGTAGLEIWRICARDPAQIPPLRDFLLKEGKLPPPLLEFLRASSGEAIHDKLIIPISWETGAPAAAVVEKTIKRKLIIHGEKTGVTPSRASAVLSRLLKEVLSTASSKEQRFLDRARFLEIFEVETTERVTLRELAALRQGIVAPPMSPLLAGAASDLLSFNLLPNWQHGVPPTAPNIALRRETTQTTLLLLRKIGAVILTGSSGTGKTTLAKLVANAIGGPWLWINFSVEERNKMRVAINHLGIVYEQQPELRNVVLDDLTLTPKEARQLEDNFAGIAYTILQRGGLLLVTTQRSFPERTLRHLGLPAESSNYVPPLSEDEMCEFAIQLGCPAQDDARSWARITQIQTSGHPQLVHARFTNLSHKQWPKPSPADVLQRPPEIAEEQSQARSLVQALSEVEKHLLYRLSMVVGVFRRNHAIAIGEINPRIEPAGDVFGSLVGPWIEPAGREYYRVSPLLKYCGSAVWTPEKVKEMVELTGFALVKCTPRTTIEADTALMHGWISRSSGLLFVVANSLLGGRPEVLETIAPSLFWLTVIATKPGQQIFPENRTLNFFLRLLQFRVAAQIEPTSAAEIFNAWDADPKPDSQPEFAKSTRMLFLSSLLYAIKVPIPSRRRIQAIVEVAGLVERFPELKEALSKVQSPEPTLADFQQFDPVAVSFMLVLAGPASIAWCEELLDAIDEHVPANLRRCVLTGLHADPSFARMFVDSVWFEESNTKNPDWPNCIRVFEKCMFLARKWGVYELEFAAARGISIIRDEYQKDTEGALAILARCATPTHPSVTLVNQRATVLLHAKRYGEAVACWEEVLPAWQSLSPYDTSVLFAVSKAGLAAGREGDWPKATILFLDGARRAALLQQPIWIAGFQVDAVWAFWKSKSYRQAFELLWATLPLIEKLPDPRTTPFAFKVQKSFSHMLLCIKKDIEQQEYGELGEPPPGMASDPEGAENWTKLPMPSMSCCLAFLAEIECYLRLPPVALAEARSRLAQSRIPIVHWLMAELEVRYAFLRSETKELPSLGNRLLSSYVSCDFRRQQGLSVMKEITTEPDYVTPTTQAQSLVTALLLQGLITCIGSGIDPSTHLARWRSDTAQRKELSWLQNWLAAMEQIFADSTAKAVAIMGSPQPSDVRLAAALKVMSDMDSDIDRFFNAQVWMLVWVSQTEWHLKCEISVVFSRLIAQQWLTQISFPSALRSPSVTVPLIQSECEIKPEGLPKAARILLAAANAVTIRLRPEVRTQLELVSKSQPTDPYRFAEK